MPGLTVKTGTLTVAVPPPAAMMTGAAVVGLTSQGTWKVIDCCVPLLLTLKIGAGVPAKLMLFPASVIGAEAKLAPTTVPCAEGAMPGPLTVARLQGESDPTC